MKCNEKCQDYVTSNTICRSSLSYEVLSNTELCSVCWGGGRGVGSGRGGGHIPYTIESLYL